MDKQMSEESSNIQAPWIPQTPMKPISPIYANTTEKQQSNRNQNQNQNQTEEGKRFDMNGLDQLSFSDLLALANTASEYFSGQKPWADHKVSPRNEDPKKMLQKGDEAVESLSSVSNNVADQIKTPEKPKRRKHRPKVVREAKPKQTPKKPVADGQAIKTPRRKYVRKKVEVNMDQESTPRRKYVRKKVEASKDQEFTPVEAVVEPAVKAKKICRRALDFVDESFKPEKGENQSNSSDTKHAGEMESAPRAKQSDSGDQESKDCLIAAPTTPKRKRSQSKRKGKDLRNNNGGNQDDVDLLLPQPAKRRQGKEPTSDINLPGFEYNGMCEYQQTQWLYVTNLQQEGISAGAMCSTSFVGQQHYAQENISAFRYESCSLTSQSSANRVLTMEEQRKGTFQGGQGFESNVCLDKIDTPTKKRTTGHARYRNLSSINKVMEVSEQSHAGCYSTPQSTNNVLVETRVTVSKTKQATKSKKSQTNQKTVLPNLRQYPATFAGLSPDEIWKQLHSVEAISEQLRVLDINREYSESALVPYSMKSQGNEIILFRGGTGAIVPLVPVKKRRPRPRVDLDNETDRVWKLLMENINSEGIDGTDEQKAKWWENERNVFRGRAESFIARMHLVQGDRRFTPWKGSVVDSIVGVFLTQNVSDHLSSSAFMSLASEYPAPSVPTENCDEGTSSMPSIQITYLDSEESMSTPPVHNPSPVTLNNTQPDEEKDDVNRDETSRSSSEIASSVQESVVKTTDSNVNVDSKRKDSSLEVDKKEQTYLVQDPFPYEDSVLTFQNSVVSDAPKNTERAGSSSEINSKGKHFTSFVKLLQDLGSARLPGLGRDVTTADTVSLEESIEKNQYENSKKEVAVSCNLGSLQVSADTSHGDCSSEVMGFKSLKVATKSSDDSNEPCSYSQQDGDVLSCQKPESSSNVASTKHKEDLVAETLIPDINESTSCLDVQEGTEVPSGPSSRQHQHSSRKELNHVDDAASKAKGKKVLKEEKEEFDWDCLRREAQDREGIREKTTRTMDSVDWEAIRTADVSEVAETIKSRGMNHKLAERIQGFLNRLITDHGSIDLEWLRDVPPDKVKEYLLSFRGLGLKSVECVRLLTLHHLAFPVDTNVGRIAVRLGWVPLQPLPESLQLHLLEMYPILESIQKYLWPRLCKLDQKTLYELHYQMITFGKVFCTKSKPNCNACPMRGECRHFASAFASARLSLPGTEKGTGTPDKTPLPLNLPEPLRREQRSEVVKHSEPANRVTCCEPIIEEPASPERECTQVSIADIEDAFYEEDPEEIPTIRLDMDSFTINLKKIMENSKELQDGNMSTALVALTAEAASLPMPKLKNISQLRTEHRVYELPDSHPLLLKLGMEKRETDDPCSYLLAIWTPGETADSIQPTVSKCIYQGIGKLCQEETCFSCNNIREARSQTVRGTVLIPCRTAMRGSFPLNGTYFQVNEVFADHASSLTPVDVPREWLWDLPRRTVYFGTSIPSIFKGLTTEIIQQCFWRGHVCVRGFDRKSRGPRPLIARLHFPASKMKSQANPHNPRDA